MTKPFHIPARKYSNQAFLVPNLGILVREILQLDKFEVLVSNMTIVFSNSTPKNTQIRIVPNLRIVILHQTLQLGKFEGADLIYDFSPKIPK